MESEHPPPTDHPAPPISPASPPAAVPVVPDAQGERQGPERLIMLSDGVFAIAITLLVLDLRLPSLPSHPSSRALADAVWALKPNIIAFVVSFWVIALYWTFHSRLFDKVRQVDGRLTQLNFALLFGIAVLPFPTSILAEYNDTVFAVALYAAVQVVIGIIFTLLRDHAMRLTGLFPADVLRIGLRNSLLTPAIFLISIVIALVSTRLAQFSWFALLLVPYAAAQLNARAGLTPERTAPSGR